MPAFKDPPPNGDELLTELRALCTGKEKSVIKIVVTRGQGGRGYKPTEREPTHIIQCFPWSDFPVENSKNGVIVRICDLRLASQPLLAGLKHLNRLENVLARAEWSDDAIAEGLLRNRQGHFIEGTMSNLFIIKNNRLFTDPLQQCGVAGIMREVIIDRAKQLGLGCSQLAIDEHQIKNADELFVCNSLIGIWPIRAVIGWGDYTVGAVTQQLQHALKGA